VHSIITKIDLIRYLFSIYRRLKVWEELKKIVHDRAMQYLNDEITQANGLALREKIREEFKIITNFGARETRYAFVAKPSCVTTALLFHYVDINFFCS